MSLDTLSAELTAWQNLKGLPNECALEQLNSGLVDESEKEWLKSFCEKWDKAQAV